MGMHLEFFAKQIIPIKCRIQLMQSRKGFLFQASPKSAHGFYLILYFFTLRISFINQGCLFMSCFNGGSCLPDVEKQTFSCSCLPTWTGDRCEVKLGNSDMNVIKHNLNNYYISWPSCFYKFDESLLRPLQNVTSSFQY